jgi:hypothetical protein
LEKWAPAEKASHERKIPMRTLLKVAAAASAAIVLSVAMASAQGTLTTRAPVSPLIPGTATTAPTGLPAGVALPAIPIANHYVCYPVKETAQFKPRTATFHDQFGTWTATVLGITHLCTPADKRAEGKVYPMVNPKLHMTCYKIKYQGGALPKVLTNDQFGPQTLYLSPATTVCLPAGKIIIK